MKNTAENETKYRLYRTVKEILHPTISKRNISNYHIILEEDLLPVQVFYPKKISNIDKVIIFIHGNETVTECMNKYPDICKEISLKTDSLLISIDYEEKHHAYRKMTEEIYQTLKHIIEHLLENNISKERIIVMGDSTAGNIITGINKLSEDNQIITKEVLIYPTLSLEYFGKTKYDSMMKNQELNFNLLENLKKYYTSIATKKELKDELFLPLKRKENIPKTLLIVGSVDCLKDEIAEYKEQHKECSYVELPFLSHGFLKRLETEEEKTIMNEIIKLIEL